uniref:Uncharacterized protein n=1 Tax=Lepeophtheirus salmonis TaxID=72036 RepID=A0A0K2T7Z1_LEPSM
MSHIHRDIVLSQRGMLVNFSTDLSSKMVRIISRDAGRINFFSHCIRQFLFCHTVCNQI